MRKLNYSLAFQVYNHLYRLKYKPSEVANYHNKLLVALSSFPICKSNFSTCPSCDLSSTSNEKGIKELSEEYPHPKSIVQRVINEAYLVLNSSNVEPNVTVKQVSDENNQNLWVVSIDMNWPESFQVEGISHRKTDAEKIAYLQTCQKLKEYGVLNVRNNPILPSKIFKIGNSQIKNAKAELSNIFQVIWRTLGNEKLQPCFKNDQVPALVGNIPQWKSVLSLSFPEHKEFEGLSHRLSDAEKVASAKALHWLHEVGAINTKKQPLLHCRLEEKRMYENQKLPYPIYIPSGLQSKIGDVIENYNELKEVYSNMYESVFKSGLKSESANGEEGNENVKDSFFRNVFTDVPYAESIPEELAERNRLLFQQETLLQQFYNPTRQERIKARSNMPIFQKKEDILRLIDQNQVVVLSGETGCGKSTQVPQYLLESFINNMNGAKCNIVVSQPRRLSSISIAEYVAEERGEEVGSTIGHQVRLYKCLPKGNGAVLFCTTGILLRKLYFNPNLTGVSHVIIDEVHERNTQIDFILILLKKLINTNKDIKVILMSASFNTSLFSQYFDNCPVIHVPGRMYPVKEHFLEDLPSSICCHNGENVYNDFQFDSGLVSRAIMHIDETKPPGAILCFLPGWNEIKAVSDHLEELLSNREKYQIRYAHSRLLPEEQKKIFEHPPQGVRKIVLSTNIAETSITVDDVVYVVDSGFYKGTTFDADKGIASIGTKWITKANVRQRRGRAGRVQPGVCYHLFPRRVFHNMDEYPIPEMIRKPLEKVVLDCKLYCPEMKAEDFLSMALQPPSRRSIQIGIEELQILEILDEEENLTRLGRTVVNFGAHPRLSKALVYAAYFRCIDPVLTICAILTMSQDPFIGTLEQSSDIRKVKLEHDYSRISDHLSLYSIFSQWDSIDEDEARTELEQKYLLDSDSLQFIKQLKGLFLENLYDAKLVPDLDLKNSTLNYNSDDMSLVLCILAASFYPNVVKLVQGEMRNGRLNKDVVSYQSLRNQKTHIQIESVASKNYDLPSPWLTFFSGMKSEARQMLMTSSVSSIPGLAFLLFAGHKISLKPEGDSSTTDCLVVDEHDTKLNFTLSERDRDQLIQFREMFSELFQIFLHASKSSVYAPRRNMIEFLDMNAVPALQELLDTAQVPFVPSKRFEFLDDGKLICHEL